MVTVEDLSVTVDYKKQNERIVMALKRWDPTLRQVYAKVSHVCLYIWQSMNVDNGDTAGTQKDGVWKKIGVEGGLFMYVDANDIHKILVLNQNAHNNFIFNLPWIVETKKVVHNNQHYFMINYRTASVKGKDPKDHVLCIWCPNLKELKVLELAYNACIDINDNPNSSNYSNTMNLAPIDINDCIISIDSNKKKKISRTQQSGKAEQEEVVFMDLSDVMALM